MSSADSATLRKLIQRHQNDAASGRTTDVLLDYTLAYDSIPGVSRLRQWDEPVTADPSHMQVCESLLPHPTVGYQEKLMYFADRSMTDAQTPSQVERERISKGWVDLGAGYMNMGNVSKAADAFRRSLYWNEKNMHGKLHLAAMLLTFGFESSACDILADCIASEEFLRFSKVFDFDCCELHESPVKNTMKWFSGVVVVSSVTLLLYIMFQRQAPRARKKSA